MIEELDYWQKRKEDDERRDWRTGEDTWVEEYWASVNHPHRKLIVDAIKDIEFGSLLEVGANCGCNIAYIKQELPKERKYLAVDVSPCALAFGMKRLPDVKFMNCPLLELDFIKPFDIVLADAVLMYIKDIDKAMDILQNIAKKAIVIVDWKADTETIQHGHYTRNYKDLLEKRGFQVEEIKIDKDYWPNEKWSTIGHLWIAK